MYSEYGELHLTNYRGRVGCSAESKCRDLLCLAKADSVICQARRASGTRAKPCLFPGCDLVPQNRRLCGVWTSHGAGRREQICHCPLPGAVPSREGHVQPSTVAAVTNSAVKHAEHLHRDSRKVLPKQLWLYAVAPGVWLRQRWDRSYDLSPCKTSSLFMGEWKSADPKAFMLRESR